MQPGFSNGQRYWTSQEGNAIWYNNGYWDIGFAKDLGTSTVSLYVPIKDPSKECPPDDLQSIWVYGNGIDWIEDVNNFVSVECLPV